MKNKKGFTLTELLAVITILAVIALIAVPAVNELIKNNSDKLYESQMKTIKNALKTWGDGNSEYLPVYDEQKLTLTLGDIKEFGFIKEDISNPKTNKCFSNNMQLEITKVGEGYNYNVLDNESTTEDCKAPEEKYIYLFYNDDNVDINRNNYKDMGLKVIDINNNSYDKYIYKTYFEVNTGNEIGSIDYKKNGSYMISYFFNYSTFVENTLEDVSPKKFYKLISVGNVNNPMVYANSETNLKSYIVPESGLYNIQVWGAKGGYVTDSSKGGNGGYVSGDINLKKGDILYFNIGYVGNNKGINVGGKRGNSDIYGGGASDVRLNGKSLNNRIIVAAGGGSEGSNGYAGGAAGISATEGTGDSACNNGEAAKIMVAGASSCKYTEISGSLGRGGNGVTVGSITGGAGGSGWYGGAGTYPTKTDNAKGGGGGSNFIWTAENKKYTSSNYKISDQYYFTDIVVKNGNESITNSMFQTSIGNPTDGSIIVTKKIIE